MFFNTSPQRHLGANFGKWLGWILVVFLVGLSSTAINNVVGGDCVISGSDLYYLAGQEIKNDKSIQRRQDNNFTNIFRRQLKSDDDFEYIISRRLDLKTGFEIQDGNAPWVNIGKEDVSSFKQTSLMYPQVVSRGGNHTGILVFSGVGSKINQELLDFDADASQFYVNIKGSSFIKIYSNSDSRSKIASAPIYGTWVQNEETPTDYLFFGGIQLLNDREKTNLLTNVAAIDTNSIHSDTKVFKYSSINKAWSVEAGDGQPSFMHSTIVFKGKMIVFGGLNPQTLKPYPWSQLRIYNIKSKSWEITEIKGPNPQPRFGHRAIRVRDTMVIVGGIIGSQNIQNLSQLNFDDRILALDLKTLKWASVTSNGWRGSYMGCLSFYNDQLIYAFGITKNQPTQGRTYIINTKTWKSVNFFTPLESHTNYQLWFFLACGFLGLLPCLFIFGIFLHRRWEQKHFSPPQTASSSTPQSQEKPRSSGFKFPSPLNYFLWSNSVIHPSGAGENVMTLTECSSESSLKTSVSRRVIEAHLSSLDNGHMNIPNNSFNNRDSSNNIPIDVFFSQESNKEKISLVLRKPSTRTAQSYHITDKFSNTLFVKDHSDSKSPRGINITPTPSISPTRNHALQRKPILKIRPTINLDAIEKHQLSPHPRANSRNSDAQSQFTILSAPFTPGFPFLMANSLRSPLNAHPDPSAYELSSSKNSTSSLRRSNSFHALKSTSYIVSPVRRGSVGWRHELDQRLNSINEDNKVENPRSNTLGNSNQLTWPFLFPSSPTANPRRIINTEVPSCPTLLQSSSLLVGCVKQHKVQIEKSHSPLLVTINQSPTTKTTCEKKSSSPEIKQTDPLPSSTALPNISDSLFQISSHVNNTLYKSSSLTTDSNASSEQSNSSIVTIRFSPISPLPPL